MNPMHMRMHGNFIEFHRWQSDNGVRNSQPRDRLLATFLP